MLNEKKYRAIYDEFLASGLTIRDYCANQSMNEAKFYYWQQKLKSQLPPKEGFVPVVFENKQTPKSLRLSTPAKDNPRIFSNPLVIDKTISCEISYPNGVSLKLNGLADMEVLRSLLVLTQQQNV